MRICKSTRKPIQKCTKEHVLEYFEKVLKYFEKILKYFKKILKYFEKILKYTFRNVLINTFT